MFGYRPAQVFQWRFYFLMSSWGLEQILSSAYVSGKWFTASQFFTPYYLHRCHSFQYPLSEVTNPHEQLLAARVKNWNAFILTSYTAKGRFEISYKNDGEDKIQQLGWGINQQQIPALWPLRDLSMTVALYLLDSSTMQCSSKYIGWVN